MIRQMRSSYSAVQHAARADTTAPAARVSQQGCC
jgi:hypothetical protein